MTVVRAFALAAVLAAALALAAHGLLERTRGEGAGQIVDLAAEAGVGGQPSGDHSPAGLAGDAAADEHVRSGGLQKVQHGGASGPEGGEREIRYDLAVDKIVQLEIGRLLKQRSDGAEILDIGNGNAHGVHLMGLILCPHYIPFSRFCRDENPANSP